MLKATVRMPRRIVAAALVGLLACIRPSDPGSGGGLSLQFDASAAAWDSVKVLVRGPTNKTVKVTPGTTVTIDGLIPGMYTVALQAFDSGGIASIFQTTSVSVVANANASLTPTAAQFVPFVPAITSLPATGTSTTFTVGFSSVTGAASYEVEAATNSAFTINRVAVTTTATSAQVTVPAFGTYYVRVRAIDAYEGRGRASSPPQTIQLAGVPPAAPSGLTATGVSTNQIDLSWTDNATNEDGFQIERCTGASCSSFTQIATVGPNITAYSNAGLTASTSYSYRVRAYNTAASSAYTNTATASTSSIVTLPAAPSSLTASAVSNSQINLSWTDNANNEDGFLIERCTGSSCSSFVPVTTTGPNVTTYSDGGLAASTNYRYRVRAYNTAGLSAFSNTATATTAATVTIPAAPSSLTASAASTSQINLGWTDNANNEDGFQIERCTGASCSSFAQVGTVGPNVTTYSDAGLTPSTSYTYRVRAYNTAGTSAPSATATAVTAATVTVPAAPSSLTASAVSTSQINLGWTDNANNEEGFQIERCAGASCANFAQIAIVGPSVTAYQDLGLAAATTYRYRVRAYNSAGNSGYSNIASATTAVTLPDAPSSLTAVTISSSQINLSWTDNSNNEDGFQIERCTGASCSSFIQLTTVGPSVTTYQNTGLAAGTSYTYRVRAYNAAGSSAYSNIASATTAVTLPAAPSSLSASAVSSSQINLSWADNANNEDAFLIERCTGASCASFAQIASVGPNVTAYQNTDLAAGTSYSYRVRANNTAGNSAYSNTATATTTVMLPAAPSGLTATGISSSQIDLSWADNANNEDGFQVERCTGASCSNFTQIATVGPNVTAYSNTTGLAASTSYNYRVRAYNAAGSSTYSNTATGTTLVAPPSAPSSLSATAVSSSQISLSWNDNSSNESGFQVERCSGSSCSNFTQIQTVGPNATTYQDNTGLTAGTLYRYRIRAFNTGGVSGYSNTANATTLPTPPSAPTGLAVTSVTSSRINLSWIDNANNEDGFEIERCTGVTCTNFVEISTSLDDDTTSYQNSGLAGSTTYRYRVYAYNTGGNSAYSNIVNGTTN